MRLWIVPEGLDPEADGLEAEFAAADSVSKLLQRAISREFFSHTFPDLGAGGLEALGADGTAAPNRKLLQDVFAEGSTVRVRSKGAAAVAPAAAAAPLLPASTVHPPAQPPPQVQPPARMAAWEQQIMAGASLSQQWEQQQQQQPPQQQPPQQQQYQQEIALPPSTLPVSQLSGAHPTARAVGAVAARAVGAVAARAVGAVAAHPLDGKTHPCVVQLGTCMFGDECMLAKIPGRICMKYAKRGQCHVAKSLVGCPWEHPDPGDIVGICGADPDAPNYNPKCPYWLQNAVKNMKAGGGQMKLCIQHAKSRMTSKLEWNWERNGYVCREGEECGGDTSWRDVSGPLTITDGAGDGALPSARYSPYDAMAGASVPVGAKPVPTPISPSEVTSTTATMHTAEKWEDGKWVCGCGYRNLPKNEICHGCWAEDPWICQCGFRNRPRNAVCGGVGGKLGCKRPWETGRWETGRLV